MPMNGSTMGSEVVDAIVAASPGYGALSPAEQAKVLAFWQAICGAIVLHIQTNAKLNFLAADISVTPGTFANGGGPVAGLGANAAVVEKGNIT